MFIVGVPESPHMFSKRKLSSKKVPKIQYLLIKVVTISVLIDFSHVCEF